MNNTLRLAAACFGCIALLTACGQGPDDPPPGSESAPADERPHEGMEPIVLHARLDYSDGSTSRELGSRGLKMSLEIAQRAFRDRSGGAVTYAQDIEAQPVVTGWVHGVGHAEVNSDDAHLEEHYDKTAGWFEPQTPASGMFNVLPPQASDIGDGLHMIVEIHAPVAGTLAARLNGQETTPNLAVPLNCTERDEHLEDHGAACGKKFDLDATPTGPKSEAGKILYPAARELLDQPNGEALAGMLGMYYGVTTEYRPGNHFILRLKKNHAFAKDGSELADDIDLVIWSTGVAESWRPEDASAVQPEPR